MQAFWIALGYVFLAEMGDKTQLVSLAFASRYSARVVMAGVFVATLAVHIVSVVLGESAAMVMPRFWIDIAAGVAFIIFGVWTLRGDEFDESEIDRASRLGPFLTVASSFFLAEIGDKTMLATITIASQQQQFVAVWLGSTVGMVAADGLAIVVGNVLGARLPQRAIKIVAAVLFLVTGIYSITAAIWSSR